MRDEVFSCKGMAIGSMLDLIAEAGGKSAKFRLQEGGPFRFQLSDRAALVFFRDKNVGRLEEGCDRVRIYREDYLPEEALVVLRAAARELADLSAAARVLAEERRRILALDVLDLIGPADHSRKVALLPVDHKEGLDLAFFADYLDRALPAGLAVKDVSETRELYFSLNVHLFGEKGASAPAFYIRSAGNRWETGSLVPGERARAGLAEDVFLSMRARRERVINNADLARAMAEVPNFGDSYPAGSTVTRNFHFSSSANSPRNLVRPPTPSRTVSVPVGDAGLAARVKEGHFTTVEGIEFNGEPIAVRRGWLPGLAARPGLWGDLMMVLDEQRPDLLSRELRAFKDRIDPAAVREEVLNAILAPAGVSDDPVFSIGE